MSIRLLIKILQLISAELYYSSSINLFLNNDTRRLSNLYLLVAGGDPHASKYIHDSLSLLNSNSNDFYIKTVCTDADVHYLYDNLKNRVTIPGRRFRPPYPAGSCRKDAEKSPYPVGKHRKFLGNGSSIPVGILLPSSGVFPVCSSGMRRKYNGSSRFLPYVFALGL
jgi:hypothetical protein